MSVQPEFAQAFQICMNFSGMSNDRKYDTFNQKQIDIAFNGVELEANAQLMKS